MAMIAALDVHYDDSNHQGSAAAVLFANWTDAAATAGHHASVDGVHPYDPGEFFRRELPCLLAVIGQFTTPVDLFVIDGYVHFDDKPALGQHLFEHFHRRIPVIGVAKTRFRNVTACEVFRGRSRLPLYVTATGIDARDAAERVKQMHGPHGIPKLLKRVDQLARRS
jgi:deoxyribonuclease V